MIYFDSDVLVNYFVDQDLVKHAQSIKLYQSATYSSTFCCSFLSLQETSFVLSRLKVEPVKIDGVVQSMFPYLLENYNLSHFERAVELARQIGFQNINDCLHTAIAEEYCDELYTYNRADFKRIKAHTRLKITIL